MTHEEQQQPITPVPILGLRDEIKARIEIMFDTDDITARIVADEILEGEKFAALCRERDDLLMWKETATAELLRCDETEDRLTEAKAEIERLNRALSDLQVGQAFTPGNPPKVGDRMAMPTPGGMVVEFECVSVQSEMMGSSWIPRTASGKMTST